jgi:hypothetical protein
MIREGLGGIGEQSPWVARKEGFNALRAWGWPGGMGEPIREI